MTAPSYRLNEWLALRKYSRAEFHRWPVEERPEIIGKGRLQRITPQADERWLKRQERKAKRHNKVA